MFESQKKGMRAHYLMACLALVQFLGPRSAFATTGDMPWSNALSRITTNLQGPTAVAVSLIIIVVTTLALAFTEVSGGSRKLIGIALCLALAHQATAVVAIFGGGSAFWF
jgi:type IV secretory pathway VirB2 component (pilin)